MSITSVVGQMSLHMITEDMKGLVKDLLNSEHKHVVFDCVENEIDHELSQLCSTVNPSVLRCTPAKELEKLTLERINSEFKTRAPHFHHMLAKFTCSPDSKYKYLRGEMDISLARLVCPMTSILQARCKEMNGWALKNSLVLQYGSCSNMVCNV